MRNGYDCTSYNCMCTVHVQVFFCIAPAAFFYKSVILMFSCITRSYRHKHSCTSIRFSLDPQYPVGLFTIYLFWHNRSRISHQLLIRHITTVIMEFTGISYSSNSLQFAHSDMSNHKFLLLFTSSPLTFCRKKLPLTDVTLQ